jgi:hypothetical protein
MAAGWQSSDQRLPLRFAALRAELGIIMLDQGAHARLLARLAVTLQPSAAT